MLRCFYFYFLIQYGTEFIVCVAFWIHLWATKSFLHFLTSFALGWAHGMSGKVSRSVRGRSESRVDKCSHSLVYYVALQGRLRELLALVSDTKIRRWRVEPVL